MSRVDFLMLWCVVVVLEFRNKPGSLYGLSLWVTVTFTFPPVVSGLGTATLMVVKISSVIPFCLRCLRAALV